MLLWHPSDVPPTRVEYERKNQPYSVESSHMCENLLKINSLSLRISLHDNPCFMLDDISFIILLQLKHPIQTDGVQAVSQLVPTFCS